MADRILIWHFPEESANLRGATYYMEKDYEPVAIRVHAQQAPQKGELDIDILDDGVSILKSRESNYQTSKTIYSEIQFGTHSATGFAAPELISGLTSSASGRLVSVGGGQLLFTLIGTTAFAVGETVSGVTTGATGTVNAFVRGSVQTTSYTINAGKTGTVLLKGKNVDPDAAEFADELPVLAEGSLVHCVRGDTGGAKNITVQMELEAKE